MNDQEWHGIVQLQQYTKSLLILAEEYELEEWKTFTQPLQEQRSALDHICRSMASELNIIPNCDKNYIEENLKKAKGHLYRAFFDTADWLSIVLRERIIREIDRYDIENIIIVIPEYYQKIRPEIEATTLEIAKIRDAKDISKNNSLIEQVKHYHEKITELLTLYQSLHAKIPLLEKFRIKQRPMRVKRRLEWATLPGVATILTFAAGITILATSIADFEHPVIVPVIGGLAGAVVCLIQYYHDSNRKKERAVKYNSNQVAVTPPSLSKENSE